MFGICSRCDCDTRYIYRYFHNIEVNSVFKQIFTEKKSNIINLHFHKSYEVPTIRTLIEFILTKLTDQLKQIRKESDLYPFREKLTQLAKELDKPPNVSIQQD